MLLRFTLLSIYSDFKQVLPHLFQEHCGENKEETGSSVLFWTNFPLSSGNVLITSAPKKENLGVLFIIESHTISYLWTQNLRLPFPITYFCCLVPQMNLVYNTFQGLTLLSKDLLHHLCLVICSHLPVWWIISSQNTETTITQSLSKAFS